MADMTGSTQLHQKRLLLMLSEQRLVLQRQELRLLELDDEKLKVQSSAADTKSKVLEIEKSLKAEGITHG